MVEERFGIYNLWFGLVKVKQFDKFKFKWCKYRVVMKCEGEGFVFIEIILWYGIFFKKRKDWEYIFVRIGDEIYLCGVIFFF